MNWEYLHLISHSFPIVLFVTGTLVGIAGWVAGRAELERWGLVAFLVGGVFVIPAYLTGLAAADVVADRTFVRPSAIQRHRTWATFAAVPLIVAAILAGFSFAEPDDRRLRRFVILVGAVAAVVTGVAATLGARIQHGDRAREAVTPTSAYPVERTEADPGVPHEERIGSDVSHRPTGAGAHLPAETAETAFGRDAPGRDAPGRAAPRGVRGR